MKQLYNITRTQFYKKLAKNKTWLVQRIKYTFQGLAYSYGCDISRGHEKITIEPLTTASNVKEFIFKYENLEQPEKSFYEVGVVMSYIIEHVNRILYA